MTPWLRSLASDSEGSSENDYSAVSHAFQPPVSEELGRKRHSSTCGEESNRHRHPPHPSATPPSAAKPASASDLQVPTHMPRRNLQEPSDSSHHDSAVLASRGAAPGK